MSYRMYTTDAFVAQSRERNSADRILWLFTENAGMVYARAIGMRAEKSKMRYALQDFSLARVSLVRGRSEWRLTGAEPETNLFFKTESRSGRARILRATRLLLRCVPGEEPHPHLYTLFRDGIERLAREDADDYFEAVFALRLLFLLGYVPDQEAFMPHIETAKLDKSVRGFHTNGVSLGEIQRATQEALEASHL